MQYYEPLANELNKLLKSYLDLYSIANTYYKITGRETDVVVEIGFMPHPPGQHKKTATLITRVSVPSTIEDEIEARAYIPKIHQAFIRQLYLEVNEVLIHRHNQLHSDKIEELKE